MKKYEIDQDKLQYVVDVLSMFPAKDTFKPIQMLLSLKELSNELKEENIQEVS